MQPIGLGPLEYMLVFCMVAVGILVVFGLYWLVRSAVRAGMRDAARDAARREDKFSS